MSQQTVKPSRAKVGVILSPEWARTIDRFIETHPESNRSKVVDEALWLWYAKQQEQAMQEQFAAEPSPEEAAEYAAWSRIRDAAAAIIFSRPEHE